MRVWCFVFLACSVIVASAMARPGSRVNRHKRNPRIFEERKYEVEENQPPAPSKFIDDYFNGRPIRSHYDEFDTVKNPEDFPRRIDDDEPLSSKAQEKVENESSESDEEDDSEYVDDAEYDDEENDQGGQSAENKDVYRMDDNARKLPPSFDDRRFEEPRGRANSHFKDRSYDEYDEVPVPRSPRRDRNLMYPDPCVDYCAGRDPEGMNYAAMKLTCRCDGYEAMM